MKFKNKKVLIAISIGAILIITGTVLGINGFFGGGSAIPSDTMTRGLVGFWNFDGGTGPLVTDNSGQGNDGLINDGGSGNPVSYWTFDEGTGTTAYDYTGSNNGTLTNGPVWSSSGKVGGAIQFDGSNDYVNANDLVADVSSDNAGSIELWVNFDAGAQQATGNIFTISQGTLNNYLQINVHTTPANSLRFSLYSTSFLTIKITTNTYNDAWHHVVVTCDGSTTKFYVDGVEPSLGTNTDSGNWLNDLSSLAYTRIGGMYYDSGESTLDGLIDDVRIYNYARDAAQIKRDYLETYKSKYAAGAPAASGGSQGNAMQFDGVDDYAALGDVLDDVFTGANKKFTLEVWIKQDSTVTGGKQIIAKLGDSVTGGDQRQLSFAVTNGKIQYSYYGSLAGVSYRIFQADTTSIIAGQWYHVVATYDGVLFYDNRVSIIINGISQSLSIPYTSGSPDSIPDGTAPLAIGAGVNTATAYVFNGLIDDVRVYNRALTAAEVRYHYNQGGPVAYWTFDEGSGTTAYDSTNNNNNGTISGATWVSGKNGNALSFDGSDDYVTVIDNSILDITDAITVSAWIKANSSQGNQWPQLVSKSIGGSTRAWEFGIDRDGGITGGGTAGAIFFQSKKSDTYYWKSTNASVLDNTWHHVVAVYNRYDSSDLRLYIDGKLDKNTNIGAGGLASTSENLYIGVNNAGTYPFKGLIDDVRIYNYARTPAEIRTDYNAGLAAHFGPSSGCDDDPGSCMTKGLVGNWDFDGGSGSLVSDKSGQGNDGLINDGGSGNPVSYWTFDEGTGVTAYDYTGSNNGTLTNGPVWTSSGKVGGALQFDGVNDYTQVSSSLIDFGVTDFAISSWIKRAVPGQSQRIVSKDTAVGGWPSKAKAFWFHGDQPNVITFSEAGVGNVFGVTLINDTSWHYVAVTFVDSSNTVKLYVDGVLDNTGTLALTSDNPDHLLEIGGPGNYFNGTIDDVRIYNYARDAAQIKRDYQESYKSKYAAGAPAAGGGTQGTALQFDGVDDYVDAGSGASLNPTSAITIEAWAKKSATKNQNIIFNDVHELKIDSSNNVVFKLMTGARLGNDMDMETAGVDNWGTFNEVSTKEKNTTNPVGGYQDLHIVAGAGVNRGVYQTIGSPGNPYRVKVSYRVVSGTLDISYDASTVSKNIGSVTGTGTIIAYITPTGSWSNLELTSSDSAEFYVDDIEIKQVGSSLTSSGIISSNFNHIVVVYDGSVSKIYVNGVLDSSLFQSTTLSTDNLATLIGTGAVGATGYGKDFFNGFIDDIRIYNRALTAAEARYHYNRGGPVAYWTFDEGSGTTAYDSTNNNNNGAISGATWVSGKNGNALSFDGTDDYVQSNNNVGISGTAPRTMGFWVKVKSNSANGHVVIGWGGGTTNLRFDVAICGGGWCPLGHWYLWGHANDCDTGTSVNLNVWEHHTVTFDGMTTRWFRNGVEIKTCSQPTLNTTDTPLSIGKSYSYHGAIFQDYFNGFIDDVRIYNYARTPAEIRTDYNAGLAAHFGPSSGCDDDPGSCMTKGLVGNWDFDGGSGSLVSDKSGQGNDGLINDGGSGNPVSYWTFDEGTGTTAYDYTGSNNGTLTNGPVWTSSGRVGGALQLDGSNDYVKVSTPSSLNITGVLTIGAWVRFNSTNANSVIMEKGVTGGNVQYAIWWEQSTAKLKLTYYNGATHVFPEYPWTPTLGVWYHLVGRWDASNVKIYIDGVEKSSEGLSGSLQSIAGDFWIGANRVPGSYFNGLIDDVRIYNYARDAAQIKRDYLETYKSKYAAGAPSASGGSQGNAIQFDGVDDYVQVPSSASLKMAGGTVLTMEARIKGNTFSTTGRHHIIEKEWVSDYRFTIYQQKPSIRIQSSGEIQANYTLSTGTWYHLMATWDGSNVRIYVNGDLKHTEVLSGSITGNDYNLAIGSYYTGGLERLDGSIDDVRIYNRALSATEVRYHYNKGGPVAYWKFDEGQGSTAYDNTNNNNDGTLGGGTEAYKPSWVRGKYGSALQFDGTNDYVQVANESNFDFERTSPFTISAWVKTSSATSQGIFGKMLTDSPWTGYSFFIANDGTLYIQIVGTSSSNSINKHSVETFADGQWHFVTMAYNGSSQAAGVKLYKDGVETAYTLINNALSTSILNNESSVIGVDSSSLTNYNFDGLIDDVRIYNYARTASQIQQDYNQGTSIHFK